jgi:purine-binding chemotaxis protein CheW
VKYLRDVTNEAIDSVEDTQKGRFLTFSVGKESYGIEIRYVKEIIGIQEITEIPELPNYIKGVINLRGTIIPVMDMRLRFKKQYREYNDRTCIVVIDISEIPIGLIVDNVSEVLTIGDENIIPPPNIKNGFHNHYVKSIGKVQSEIKLLLDCDKLLSYQEIEILNRAV